MTSCRGPLTGFNVTNPNNPSEVIAEIGFAVLPVVIQELTDGKPSGLSLNKNAAIDTGSTTTALHPSLATRLNLKQVASELGSEPRELESGPGKRPPRYIGLYGVRISLNEGGDWWELPVMIRDYDYGEFFQILIGLDILRDCRFTYDGPGDLYTLDRLR
jgi:hypothetical protein